MNLCSLVLIVYLVINFNFKLSKHDEMFCFIICMEWKFHMIAIENIFLFFLTMISVSYAIMYMYTAHSIIWTDLL